MAKYSIEITDEGDKCEKLIFAGKEYVCRTRHFIGGTAKGLDKCLASQIEDDYPNNDKLSDVISDLEFNADDGQTIVPRLTKMERKLAAK